MFTFTIFSKAGCSHCARTKELMHKLGLKYSAQELELGDYTKEEFFSRFGMGATFPQVVLTEWVAGQDGSPEEVNCTIGGMRETVTYLKAKNYI
jgi:glutaredoxin 3